MRPAPRLERKNAFRVSRAEAKTNRPVERRPSFAARMFQLLFQRKASSSLDENRPKSWSGTPEKTAPEASFEPFVRHASTNVILPRGSGSSIRPSDLEETGDEEDKRDASWRKLQLNCVNCDRLFFTSLSTLSCGSSRFCSLDCKTTFEYVNHLQEVLAEHMLGVSTRSDGSLDSSLGDGEYEVEEFDADQL